MGFKLNQSLKLSQNLVMTPQLQQAIKLLQMNRLELQNVINQELVENPMLEEVVDSIEEIDIKKSDEEKDVIDGSSKDIREELEKQGADQGEDFNWEAYLDGLSTSPSYPTLKNADLEELPNYEATLSNSENIEDHLNWQIGMMGLTESESKLAQLIVGSLNADGYLTCELEELAAKAEVDDSDAEEIHRMIRYCDPVGIGSRTLQENLLTQITLIYDENKKNDDLILPRKNLMERVIQFHLSDIEKKNLAKIMKETAASKEEIINAIKFIQSLEAKPARRFTNVANNYITPDIYVIEVNGEFIVSLNEEGIPRLKLSSYYKDLFNKSRDKNTPQDTKQYIDTKLKDAVWLIKSIHNRQRTIFRVTECIVRRQAEFFKKGVEFLKPMVLRDIAGEISLHESTISRVTSNKYVHTPVGVFELKYFFSSGVASRSSSEGVASESVRQMIKKLIDNEDEKDPLSDDKISELLKRDGIKVSRRTVAKYRDSMGILSSAKRKKIF